VALNSGAVALSAAGAIALYAGITGQTPASVFRAVAGGKKPAAPSTESAAADAGKDAGADPSALTSASTGSEMDTAALTGTWGAPGSSQSTINFQGHLVEFHSGTPAAALSAVSAAISAAATGYVFHTVETLSIRGRTSDASQMSYHAYGLAIDINPQTNPYVASGAAASYDIPESVVAIFQAHSFVWGGSWSTPKDYMHFEFHGAP
jgi:hypothetical protein